MNILVLSHRVPFPPNKGEKIRTFYQLKHLCDKGYKVTVLFPAESSQDEIWGQQLAATLNCQVHFARQGNRWLRMLKGLLLRQPLSVSNFYNRDLQSQLEQLLSDQRFDSILCTASSMAEYLFRLPPQYSSLRWVMDFMDLDSDKWLQYASQSRFPMSWVYKREYKLLSRYEDKIAKRFSACLFVAEPEAILLRQRNPESSNIQAIENGLDTEAFRPSAAPNRNLQPVFLFTGVMDYSPNVDAVLWFTDNVWKQVRERWPQARFIVAGMNPEPRILALADKHGIEVTGFVDDILPYYHQADIFVAPFRMARGVQNKILQAFACGLPVVTTPKGLEGIHARDNEHILVASSPNEYFDAICQLFDQQNIFEHIRSNALNLIEQRYSWQGVLAHFDQQLFQTQAQCPPQETAQSPNEVSY